MAKTSVKTALYAEWWIRGLSSSRDGIHLKRVGDPV
jgi:hypothetical protein